MTGNFAPLLPRGTPPARPTVLWAAFATPASDENGRLKDLELRTLEAQDGFGGLLLMPSAWPFMLLGTCGNFRFLVDMGTNFCEMGRGVFGTGIEKGF